MNIIRKIIKWLFLTFVVLLCLDVFLVASFAVFSSQYEKADAVIILGAAINSPALYNRSMEALRLYEESWAPVIVLSGGRKSETDISEATYMQRVIQSKATKPLKVIIEDQSRSTYENLKNSKAKLPNATSVIIVTDRFHLARAAITARAVGFKKVYWSGTNTKYKKGELVYHYFRETAGIIAYLPKFMFQ